MTDMKGRKSVAFFFADRVKLTENFYVNANVEGYNGNGNQWRKTCQVGRIFHVNATVFKNPLNCIGYISFMQAWFYRGNGNDCTLIASS